MQIYALFTVLMALMTSVSVCAQNKPADPQAVEHLRDGIDDDQARLKRLQTEQDYYVASEALRLNETMSRALVLPDGRNVLRGKDSAYVDERGRRLSDAEVKSAKPRDPSHSSMNAGAVLSRMAPDQLAGFIQGLGQMTAYRLAEQGETQKALCVQNYTLGRGNKYLNLAAYRFLSERTERRVEPMVYALLKAACGLQN